MSETPHPRGRVSGDNRNMPARIRGSTIHRLRGAFKYRHDYPGGQVRVRRDEVRALVGEVRDERVTGLVPELPGICGDMGTLGTRHVWGPRGPNVHECSCPRCVSDRKD